MEIYGAICRLFATAKGLELMEFCRWGVDGASCSFQSLSMHAEELWFKVAGLKAEDDALV